MKLNKTKNNIYYIENVKFMDLIRITENGFPVCDECLKDLIGYNDIILIPILNGAYCKQCGIKKLKEINYYAEDEEIHFKRVQYYCEVLGIKQ